MDGGGGSIYISENVIILESNRWKKKVHSRGTCPNTFLIKWRLWNIFYSLISYYVWKTLLKWF